MKKTSLHFICAVFLLLPIAANAQLYMRIGSGYSTTVAGQYSGNYPYNGTFALKMQQYNGAGVFYGQPAYNTKSASFAAGFQGYLGVGYNFSKHIGLLVDANVGIINKKFVYKADVGTGYYTITRRAEHSVFLLPALVVQTGNDAANVYAKMGIVVPLRTSIMERQVATYSTTDLSIRMSNYFSLGAAGALGIQHKCGNNINIWTEASLQALSLFAKKEEFVSVTGYNPNTPGTASSVQYSKNTTDVAQRPSFTVPFSTVGISAGISFGFSRAHKVATENENK